MRQFAFLARLLIRFMVCNAHYYLLRCLCIELCVLGAIPRDGLEVLRPRLRGRGLREKLLLHLRLLRRRLFNSPLLQLLLGQKSTVRRAANVAHVTALQTSLGVHRIVLVGVEVLVPRLIHLNVHFEIDTVA